MQLITFLSLLIVSVIWLDIYFVESPFLSLPSFYRCANLPERFDCGTIDDLRGLVLGDKADDQDVVRVGIAVEEPEQPFPFVADQIQTAAGRNNFDRLLSKQENRVAEIKGRFHRIAFIRDGKLRTVRGRRGNDELFIGSILQKPHRPHVMVQRKNLYGVSVIIYHFGFPAHQP